jgi:hypothetical protein
MGHSTFSTRATFLDALSKSEFPVCFRFLFREVLTGQVMRPNADYVSISCFLGRF